MLETIIAEAERRHRVLLTKLADVDLVAVRTALRRLTAVVRSELEL